MPKVFRSSRLDELKEEQRNVRDAIFELRNNENISFKVWEWETAEEIPSGKSADTVQSEGIVNGYPDGTFKPDNTINRAEFTKIFVESTGPYGLDECINKYVLPDWTYIFFPDVLKTDWFAKYVCKAKRDGYIDGYPDGTFKPAQNINFAEAAKLISKKFAHADDTGTAESCYQQYVEALELKNAIPTSIKSTDQKITRGEMAEIMYRLLQNINTKPSASFFNKQDNVEDKIVEKDENSVAVIFLYIDEPMPDDLMERLSDDLRIPKINHYRLTLIKNFIKQRYSSKLASKIKNKVEEFLDLL